VGTVLGSLAENWQEFCRNIKKKEGSLHLNNNGDILTLVFKLQQLLSTQGR